MWISMRGTDGFRVMCHWNEHVHGRGAISLCVTMAIWFDAVMSCCYVHRSWKVNQRD